MSHDDRSTPDAPPAPDGIESGRVEGLLLGTSEGTSGEAGTGRAADAAGTGGKSQERWYVAGPMTGYPDLNFPAFHRAAADLRALGHHVENPAEINPMIGADWADCMRADIRHLVTCDAILTLPGWTESRGASLEVHIAQALGMRILGSWELPK